MTETPTCLRCGGAIEEGFVPDRGDYDVESATTTWVEGEPQTSFWIGLKTEGRRRYKIVASRCVECGTLDFVARDRVE